MKDYFIFYWGVQARGLRLSNLTDHLFYLLGQWSSPDVFIIHAGTNDLGKVKTWDFICEIKRDVSPFELLFPLTVMVFLEMVPRLL